MGIFKKISLNRMKACIILEERIFEFIVTIVTTDIINIITVIILSQLIICKYSKIFLSERMQAFIRRTKYY